MEHVFPLECFCIARQMLRVCLYANAKESLAENAAPPLASRLSPLVRATSAVGWQRAMVAALARQRKSGLALHLLLF